MQQESHTGKCGAAGHAWFRVAMIQKNSDCARLQGGQHGPHEFRRVWSEDAYTISSPEAPCGKQGGAPRDFGVRLSVRECGGCGVREIREEGRVRLGAGLPGEYSGHCGTAGAEGISRSMMHGTQPVLSQKKVTHGCAMSSPPRQASRNQGSPGKVVTFR